MTVNAEPKRKAGPTRTGRTIRANRKTARPRPRPEARPAERENGSSSLDPLASIRALPASTSRIVEQAASILEEELAAGIVTAKRIEHKVMDVKKLRDQDSQETMQRFRRDAHEVIDILMDVVNLATNSLGDLTQRVIRISAGQPAEKAEKSQPVSAPGGIPALNVEPPVKAGQAVEIPLTLENGGDNPTEEFCFFSSNLLNASGDQISARYITFTPSAVVIDPHSSLPVTVTVAVPEGITPGTYSGLVQASRMELLRAVLTIRVE